MKNLLTMIFLITLTINNSFADNIVPIKLDEPAPFSGYVITKERLTEAYKAEKKVVLLEDLKLTQDSLIKYHKDDAAEQRSQLSKAKFKSNLYNIGYFLLGVVLSSYAFKVSEDIRKWVSYYLYY